MSNPSVVQTNLEKYLKLIGRGKVRDLYEVNDDLLLFIATDRISAFDYILNNGIPDKGKVLTRISLFWFEFLKDLIPNHLAEPGLDQDKVLKKYLPKELIESDLYAEQISGRALIVKKLKIIPLEVIVRGYLTGSAWKEYKTHGTVHGQKFPPGMQESQQFETPIFTPSTKAEQGEHDENISFEKAVDILKSEELAQELRDIAIGLYKKAEEYAQTTGIVIADTKFEFGFDADNNVVLVDEVLTPDSSRFWGVGGYALGKTPVSFDKQFVRNWLLANDLANTDNVTLPPDIVEKTRRKYIDVYERLTSQKW